MSASSLKYRLATIEDATQLQDIIQQGFRTEDSRPNWSRDMGLGATFSIDVNLIVDRITKPESAFLLFSDENDESFATIGVSKAADRYARVALLAVLPHRQQGGAGRQILQHAEQYCQEVWDATKCGLNALSTREELMAWYKRRGYKETGELVPFPPEAARGIDISELYFVEMVKDLTPTAVV